jgi:hypothetical protein
MELNAEQIKKALECCKTPLASDCENCSYTGKRLEDGVYEGCVNCLVGDALALINSQEQKIFELENRLKECENGYKGTNFLDRCKLHDAEEKVKKLTEEIERLREENNRLVVSEVSEVTIGLERIIRVRDEHPVVMAIRADTVKKMQERLFAKKFVHKNFGELVYIEDIDEIAKEMLEENKNDNQ